MKKTTAIITCSILFIAGLCFAFAMESQLGTFRADYFVFAFCLMMAALYIQVKYVLNDSDNNDNNNNN